MLPCNVETSVCNVDTSFVKVVILELVTLPVVVISPELPLRSIVVPTSTIPVKSGSARGARLVMLPCNVETSVCNVETSVCNVETSVCNVETSVCNVDTSVVKVVMLGLVIFPVAVTFPDTLSKEFMSTDVSSDENCVLWGSPILLPSRTNLTCCTFSGPNICIPDVTPSTNPVMYVVSPPVKLH